MLLADIGPAPVLTLGRTLRSCICVGAYIGGRYRCDATVALQCLLVLTFLSGKRKNISKNNNNSRNNNNNNGAGITG